MITRFLIACALVIAALTMAVSWMTGVRGSSDSTAVVASMDRDEKLEEMLRYAVQELSFEIGARSLNRYGQLQRAAGFIEDVLKENAGKIAAVSRPDFLTDDPEPKANGLVGHLDEHQSPREIGQ